MLNGNTMQIYIYLSIVIYPENSTEVDRVIADIRFFCTTCQKSITSSFELLSE